LSMPSTISSAISVNRLAHIWGSLNHSIVNSPTHSPSERPLSVIS
jgi:hypothetical protein